MRTLIVFLSLFGGGCLGCAPSRTIRIQAEPVDTLTFSDVAIADVVNNAANGAMLCLHGTANLAIPQIKVEEVSVTDDYRTCNGVGLLTYNTPEVWQANWNDTNELLYKTKWQIIICIHSLWRRQDGVIALVYEIIVRGHPPSTAKQV